VLHIAAALSMKTVAFASFDKRQRQLAATVGLQLLPVSFENR
jgi:hypothetical protein